MKKTLLGISIAAALLAMSANVNAATRDLVFEDEDEPVAEADASVEKISVKTTVELVRNGEKSNVSPSTEFQSGDKVKLLFTPNTDGYVYWMAKGTSGDYSMLYPNAKAGMNNEIKRNETYTVPAKGSFKFDDKAGNEEILCIISTERLADLDAAAANQFKDATEQLDNLTAMNQPEEKKKSATRDLVFEDEEEVNTATQTTPKGEPVVIQYTLVHK